MGYLPAVPIQLNANFSPWEENILRIEDIETWHVVSVQSNYEAEDEIEFEIRLIARCKVPEE